MKITPEHVAIIKDAIAPLDTAERRARYRDAGIKDPHKRYRWDLLWGSGLTTWVCGTLYKYSHDEHIDTVLRSLVPPFNTEVAHAADSTQ